MDAYGAYALRHPEKLKFVAVAEPNEARRSAMAAAHHIPPDRCFDDWKPLLALGKIADSCLVCTQDRFHVEPAEAALKLGYHVLCEKPMHPEAEALRGAGGGGKGLGQNAHHLPCPAVFALLHPDQEAPGRRTYRPGGCRCSISSPWAFSTRRTASSGATGAAAARAAP